MICFDLAKPMKVGGAKLKGLGCVYAAVAASCRVLF